MGVAVAVGFITTLIGNCAGSKAESWLNKGVDNLYRQIIANVNEPANHHIQRAIRKSYLSATLLAVKYIESKRKWYKLSDARWDNIIDVKNFVKKEIENSDKEQETIRASNLDTAHRAILFSKDGTSAEKMEELILNLKNSIIKELENKRLKVETELKTCILEGWKEGIKEMDFYKLLCAFFTQELKDNTQLSVYIQTEYLDSIKTELRATKLTVDDLKNSLEIFFEEYKSVLPLVKEILSTVIETNTTVKEIDKKLNNIPQETAKLVLEEIKNNTITLDQLIASDSYKNQIKSIAKLLISMQNINNQILQHCQQQKLKAFEIH